MSSLHERLRAETRAAGRDESRHVAAGDDGRAARCRGVAEGLRLAADIIGFGGGPVSWLSAEKMPLPQSDEIWAYLFDTGIRRLRWMPAEERCARHGWSQPSEESPGDGAWVEVHHPDQEWKPKFWLPLELLPLEPERGK